MTAYIRPASVQEVVRARADHPDYLLLAGGTDALVAANRRAQPNGIIDVFGLPAMSQIVSDDQEVRIGAAAPYTDIIGSAIVQSRLPMLAEACREIGALQIQARGTLGGNVATASPVGDSLPVLLAGDAYVELASVSGRRRVRYEEFCVGYRKTTLRANEVIVCIGFPIPRDTCRQFWRKVGTRRAQSISKVMMAAVAHVESERIAAIRIGMGAVAAQPIRVRRVEAALVGQRPTADRAAHAAEVLASEIKPIDDVRSTSRYRLRVAQNIVSSFVRGLGRTA